MNKIFENIWFVGAIALLLRLLVCCIGFNYDMESWNLVAEIAVSGKNVYVETARYNYGPIFIFILAFLKSILNLIGLKSVFSLHLALVIFLSLTDISIAIVSKRFLKFNGWGLLLLFNPVSILITGFHSQFDNLAILFALISWTYLYKPNDLKSILIGAIWLGFSITTKHIFIFFPLIYLFVQNRTIKSKIIVLTVPYILFFTSFLPFILNSPFAFKENIDHVFKYGGAGGESCLLPIISDFFIPKALLNPNLNLIPILGGPKLIFILSLIIIGGYLAQTAQNQKETIFNYTILMVALSTSFVDLYIAIPCISLLYYSRSLLLKIYFGVSTVYLIFLSTNNISRYIYEFCGLPFKIIIMDAYRLQIYLMAFVAFLLIQRFYDSKTKNASE